MYEYEVSGGLALRALKAYAFFLLLLGSLPLGLTGYPGHLPSSPASSLPLEVMRSLKAVIYLFVQDAIGSILVGLGMFLLRYAENIARALGGYGF